MPAWKIARNNKLNTVVSSHSIEHWTEFLMFFQLIFVILISSLCILSSIPTEVKFAFHSLMVNKQNSNTVSESIFFSPYFPLCFSHFLSFFLTSFPVCLFLSQSLGEINYVLTWEEISFSSFKSAIPSEG